MVESCAEELSGVLANCAAQLEAVVAEVVVKTAAEAVVPTAAREVALTNVLQALERIAGLCRLWGARRAVLFCSELAGLLTQFVRMGGASQPGSLGALVRISVLHLSRFLKGLSPAVNDEEFDVGRLNNLRAAAGKSLLPEAPDGTRATDSPLLGSCPVPDILPLLRQRVRGVQAMFGQASTAAPHELSLSLLKELDSLDSVLQVLGPTWFGSPGAEEPRDAGRIAGLLLRLDLQIGFLLATQAPARISVPEAVLGRRKRSVPVATECLLHDARQRWYELAHRRLSELLGPLAAAPISQGAVPEDVGCALLALYRPLQLVTNARDGLLPRSDVSALLTECEHLLQHLWCWQRVATSLDGGIPQGLAARGRRLVLHVQLLLLRALDAEAGNLCPGDSLWTTPAWRKLLTQQKHALVRDSRHLQRLQRSSWRRRLATEYPPEPEWLNLVGAELAAELNLMSQNLQRCQQQGGSEESDFPADLFCTVVCRQALNALLIGELELYEVLESLRQLLTTLLERQVSVGADELAVLRQLHELLHSQVGPPPGAQEQHGPSPQMAFGSEPAKDALSASTNLPQKALASLQISISACVARWQALPRSDDVDVSVERACDDGLAQRACIAIAQLPVYLAQNIRELLPAAERLEACANDPGWFAGLNRVLIVELRMLATGARALQVYRVARLSAVLAEVHQALAESTTACPEATLLTRLADAHRQLRRGLNQAAARREVSNPREAIASLYQCLDQLQAAPQLVSHDRLPGPWPHTSTAFEFDSESFRVFRREAEALVERIDAHLSGLSASLTAAVPDELLHALHTLKGSARLFGCERIASLCHRSESVLLAGKPFALSRPTAVAECSSAVQYDCHNVDDDAVERRNAHGKPLVNELASLGALISELRVALDELSATGPSLDDPATHEQASNTRPPAPCGSVFLAAPEHSVPIPALALQRITALAGSARTQVRAALDVLQSCRHEQDAARLSLLVDLLIEQERCIVQLDEEVAGSRLVSFARVTPRLQRLAGRHSNQLDRQLRFQVRNDALRVDRLMLEQLIAPLEHLLRNAIDHGIEPISLRRARGKPDGGFVTLDMQERDANLVLELRDDGAGIDSRSLTERASQLGMALEVSVESQQRLQWVLLPGFSTRKRATQDAGHGIGLAMVNSVVTALGGRVEVESTAGVGSCFRLLLPRWDIAPKPV